jgi:PPOX class probable F420-dependent enzyme
VFGSPIPSSIPFLSSTYSSFVASSQPTEVVAWANNLLESERVARLGLLDEVGAPRVLPVTFALAEGRIWSAIDQKPKRAAEPARLRFLRRDPRAALTVDRYSDDWEELAWVQVLGSVRILDASEGASGLAALREKYEQYREKVPPGPLLALEPERYLWWRAADSPGPDGRSGGRGE